MYNGIDLRIEIECISDDKILNGLLTKGNKYIAIRRLNIGDFLIENDDNGKKRYYKCQYFKITKIFECDYFFHVGDTFVNEI